VGLGWREGHSSKRKNVNIGGGFVYSKVLLDKEKPIFTAEVGANEKSRDSPGDEEAGGRSAPE